MNELKLKKLQESLLIIVDEINRICRENKLKYSLAAGSLLGAVRHKGIIPWDDDVDVVMPREDYETFISLCMTELNNNFSLTELRTNNDYGYGFAKLSLKDTEVLSYISKTKIKKSEIWVDIFPYDNVPNNKIQRSVQKTICYFYKKCLEERYDGYCEKAKLLKKISFIFLHLWNRIVPVNKVKNRFIFWSTKYNHLQTDYKTCICGYYGYEKEMLKSNSFNIIVEYDFSGRKLFGLKNYDQYLRKLYGDYMVLPPEEKRHTHNLKISKI